MQFSQVILTSLMAVPAASAFMTTSTNGPVTALSSSSQLNAANTGVNMNGWVADSSKFAYGLPGSIQPYPDFDPFGFAEDADVALIKQYRESEVTHGRVAMLAFVGLLVTEQPFEFHPLFTMGNKDIGPAIRHLDEVRAVAPKFFFALSAVIGLAELGRALTGFETPGNFKKDGDGNNNALKPNYYPGDIGFDPLGLKPTDADKFAQIQTKELQNGRLAMLGVAGILAQELINGKEIFVNLGLAKDSFDPASLPVQF